MTEGSNAYNGLAVPLNGNFEIVAQDATLDIATITHAAAGAGDYIVCQSANGAEMFVVEDGGKVTVGGGGLTVTSGGLTVTAGDTTVTAGDVVIGDGFYLRFSSNALITAPTTGLTLGDTFMFQAANAWTLGLCIDGSNTLKTVALAN